MKTWIFFLVIIVLVWTSSCTRPYSTSPVRENQNLDQGQISPSPEVDQPQVGTAFPAVPSIPTEEPGSGSAVDETFRPSFIPQAGSPVWMANTMHPEEGCNWMGVAGQVFDAQSAAVEDLVMTIGGDLNGEPVSRVSLTGIAPQYGEGGYEVHLADRSLASSRTLWLQILDLQGRPLTEKFYFDTLDDCERNLVLINFVQASTGEFQNYFLPIVRN